MISDSELQSIKTYRISNISYSLYGLYDRLYDMRFVESKLFI